MKLLKIYFKDGDTKGHKLDDILQITIEDEDIIYDSAKGYDKLLVP